tara:strand:- start:2400 stop:3698 length:1299 start_codon:yes stop_codon:yes gene_type:complete
MKKLLLLFFIFLSLKANILANEMYFYASSALKNNPKYKAEIKNYDAIKQNKNISRSEFLPSVTLSGSIDSSISSNRKDKSGNSLADSNLDTEVKKIEVEQKIFQGFQGYNSFKKSELEIEQAGLELKITEQNTILEAVQAYADLSLRIKNFKFNKENTDLFERQVESDNSRLQKGEITLSDLAQAESSLAKARANLISAETELLAAKTNFQRVIGIKTPGNVSEISVNILPPIDFSTILKKSTVNNPKLLVTTIDYEISKKNLSIEMSKISPSAKLNYSKSESSDFSSSVDEVDQESVKATVTWPIIKGGKNYSTIKKSKLKKQQSELILEDVKNKVKTDTTNFWSIYKSSKSILASTAAQLKAAEIASEGITLEYDSGDTRTTLDVIQSRSLLLEAKIANAKAKRDLMVSELKILAHMGELNLEALKNPIN